MAGLTDVKLHLITCLDDALEFKRWASKTRSVLCVDTETTGLQVWKDRVRLVQFGDADDGWAMDWNLWRGVAREVIAEYEGDVVFHNAKYDVAMMANDDVVVPWRSVHDTMTMAHLLDPTQSVALKSLTSRLVDSRAAAAQGVLTDAMSANKWTWSTVPIDFEPYWAYGALDTVLTARLHDILRPQIESTYGQAYELEMATQAVLMNMQRRGIRVDLEYAAQKRTEFELFAQQAREWGVQAHGVSLTSNAQLAKRFTELGVQLWKTTPKGAVSMDEEVLLEIITRGGEAGQLATYAHRVRKVTKLASTYFTNFIDLADGDVLHCNIRPMGARTGRMSITEPALQTLPRADEDNPLAVSVRNCFVASEGCKLVMIDFDQIELRLMAHFSGDPTMLSVMHDSSGLDPFTQFARLIYRDDAIVKKDPRRQLTKNASYAKMYGAGVAKFSLTAGVSEQEGAEFLALFDQRFPGVVAFQQTVQRVAQQRGHEEGEAYVKSPIGRRQPCDRGKEYKLVNYLIQGTAGDVLKQKLVALDLAGFGPYMCLPVHDEVVFDFPEEIAAEAGREAAHIMAETQDFRAPLTVGVDGPYDRWGEKYA